MMKKTSGGVMRLSWVVGFFIAALLGCNSHMLEAKRPRPKGDIKSLKYFTRAINNNLYTVAILYSSNTGPELQRVLRTVDRLKRSLRYEDSRVRFIKVNIDRHDLDVLVDAYGLQTTTIPTIILFKDGQQVTGPTAQGFLQEAELREWIEQAWGAELTRFVEDTLERRRRRYEERCNSFWWRFVWSFGYRPRSNIGFGFYV